MTKNQNLLALASTTYANEEKKMKMKEFRELLAKEMKLCGLDQVFDDYVRQCPTTKEVTITLEKYMSDTYVENAPAEITGSISKAIENSPLFSTVINGYENKLEELEAQVETLEKWRTAYYGAYAMQHGELTAIEAEV